MENLGLFNSLPETPHSVDIRIIGRCDLRCPFCFGPKFNIPAMDEFKAFCLVDYLHASGVKNLVITGGEPTLVDYLPEFLKYIKSKKINIALSTNGINFSLSPEKYIEHLDWIALPLDGFTAEINAKSRVGKYNQFKIVIDILQKIRGINPKIKIKLGTVISEINHASAHLIMGKINPYYPDVWKIYQVSDSFNNLNYRDLLFLPTDKFNDAADRCLVEASKANVDLVVYRNSERSGKYIFIEPNFDVMVIEDGNEKYIGNIFNSPDLGNRLAIQKIDLSLLKSNFNETYR